MILLQKQEEIVQVVARILNVSYIEFKKYENVKNFIENMFFIKNPTSECRCWSNTDG